MKKNWLEEELERIDLPDIEEDDEKEVIIHSRYKRSEKSIQRQKELKVERWTRCVGKDTIEKMSISEKKDMAYEFGVSLMEFNRLVDEYKPPLKHYFF